jgi:hypothetical protein
VDLGDSAEAALAVAVQEEIGRSTQNLLHLEPTIQFNQDPIPGAIQEFLRL